MLTIQTWCLPKLSEDELLSLHEDIVKAVISVANTGVRYERDMLNLFPADMMSYGLGDEVKIEITDIPLKMTRQGRTWLAEAVGSATKKRLPTANVHCVVRAPNPQDGNWPSQ